MGADPRGLLKIAALSLALTALAGALLAPPPAARAEGGSSLRFYGAGPGDLDRVKIPLGPLEDGQISGSYPLNVAYDFTLEFWMQASADDNQAPDCAANGWYYGNILIDRDIFGDGDYGDYGVALCDRRLAYGVSVGADDRWLLSTVPVADGQWHHIALTRVDGGPMAIYVDGQPAGTREGPAGRIDYRTGRSTDYPGSDPYLVIGAEKHDYPGSAYYSGFIDDLRISNVVRYSAPFDRPGAPLETDSSTVALYHFDEGAGMTVRDSSAAAGGPADGLIKVGGPQGGPAWSSNTPFGAAPAQPPTAPAQSVTPPAAELPTAPIAAESAGPTAEPLQGASTAESGADATPPQAVTDVPELVSTASDPGQAPPQETSSASSAEVLATETPAEVGAGATGGAPTPPSAAQDTAPPPEPVGAPLMWAFAIAAVGLALAILAARGWRQRAR